MQKILGIILLGSCICASVNTSARDIVPVLFEANYSIKIKGAKVAEMTRKFSKLDNGNYQYHSETVTTGIVSLFRKDRIVETSHWYLDNPEFIPLNYFYDHSGSKKKRKVNISFDWDNNRITNSIDGSSWKMPAEPRVLDKLLYQLAIMYDLQAGGKNLSYTVADGGKTKIYNFEYLGEETIKTPLGALETVKLERHKPNSRRKSTLWCARDLSYLPVKVENIEKDGRVTVALIQSLTGIPIEN